MKKPVFAFISLYTIENSGIRLLGAILRKAGYKVVEIYFKDWVNNLFKPPTPTEVSNLINILKEYNVSLVGFSVRASAYHRVACYLTNEVRKALKVPILWGGMHPTFLPEESIKCADLICIGEAEDTILDIAKGIEKGDDLTNILGVWVKKKDKIYRNPVRNLVHDLDSLPFRDFHSPDKFFIDGKKVVKGDPYAKEPVFQMKCNRGCPFSTCAYCDAPILRRIYEGKGCYYRIRSVDSVIEELLYAKRHFPNLKKVRFDDEIFPTKKEWLLKFCKLYKEKINLPFEILLHPKTIKEENLKMLMDAGLEYASMGIQNTERINYSLYNRRIKNEEIIKAANIIHKVGLDVAYHIVLDDPVSTPKDKEELFNLLMSLPRPFDLYLFSLTIFPESDLAHNLLKQGLITEEDVEGKAQKAFYQWRVDLSYPRPPEDKFWISLYVLLSKNFVPKPLLTYLSKQNFLKKHPYPLVLFSQGCNLIKMSLAALDLLIKGELNWTLIKRWANIKSLITK